MLKAKDSTQTWLKLKQVMLNTSQGVCKMVYTVWSIRYAEQFLHYEY
jgi:hypothetical protein